MFSSSQRFAWWNQEKLESENIPSEDCQILASNLEQTKANQNRLDTLISDMHTYGASKTAEEETESEPMPLSKWHEFMQHQVTSF